ncbi:hypothetical protein ACFWGD_05820 [Corynebacterium sp. NPDC060344]|uniref:hypothetical protein n=1 Tax=Corynebacterium sp. NPDC060344 TaxID=3347101 RepID=UPI00365103DD
MRYKDSNLPIGPLTSGDLLAKHGIHGTELAANYVQLRDGRHVRADHARDMGMLIDHATTRYPDGVIGFWGAAHAYGHKWLPWDALPAVFVESTRRTPVDAISLDQHLRGAHPGSPALPMFAMARNALPSGAIEVRGGLRCTSPLRTAFDLSRIQVFPDAVAAVDGLCAAVPGLIDDVRRAAQVKDRSMRGIGRFREVAALASELSESPWESRTNVLIHAIGLEGMVQQHSVIVVIDGIEIEVRMDFANVLARTGVEYLGKHHQYEHNRRWDQLRTAALARLDWKLVPLDARAVTTRWHRTARGLRTTMAQRMELGRLKGWG